RHLALRLEQRDAARETADDVELPRLARPPVRVVGIETERRPDVDRAARRKIEVRRHDADDGVRLCVELNRAAEDARRPAEMPLPERAADDGDVVLARLAFFGGERAAEDRVRAKHGEQIRRGTDARNVERLARTGE